MELIGAEISGYRRFRDVVRMDLTPRLVSIVGPNAAGKSSFLDALMHLNNDGPYLTAEVTRGEKSPFVEARFALSADDRNLLTNIPEAKGLRQILVRKDSSEPREYLLEPEPQRDLKTRKAVAARVAKLADNIWVEAATEAQERERPDEPLSAQQLVNGALKLLQSETDLDGNDLDALANLDQLLSAVITEEYFEDGPILAKRFHRIAGDLQELVEEEQVEHPREAVLDLLKPRLPRFIKFERDVRDYNAPYETVEDGDPAVANLLALAGTRWGELQRVVESEDPADRVVWRDDANAEFSKVTVVRSLQQSTSPAPRRTLLLLYGWSDRKRFSI